MLTLPLHRTKLASILQDLAGSPCWSMLGFKGGTLAYFAYGLDRFSTDLDFDLIKPVDEQILFQTITAVLEKHGRIADQYNKQWTYFWLLNYEQGEMNIKIEINKRIRKNDRFSLTKILGTEYRCMEKTSMFANKLVALTERKRTVSRDLYDINFFFRQGWSINDGLIIERTGLSTKEYLTMVRDFIRRSFNSTNLLAGLGEVLTGKQKVRVKEKLIDETIAYIDLVCRGIDL